MAKRTNYNRRELPRTAAALVIAALLSAPALGGKPQSAEPTGIAAFTRLPKHIDAKISPKGTYLGILVNENGKKSLGFINLKTRQFASGLTPDRGQMVLRFIWANDERAIAQVGQEDPMYSVAVNYGELYATSANGRGHEVIFSARKDFEWAHLMSRIRNDDHSVLISTRAWREVGDRIQNAYSLNIFTGRKQHLITSPIPGAEFVADENGTVRLAIGTIDYVEDRIFYREPAGQWRELTALKGLSEGDVYKFSATDRVLYMAQAVPGGGFGLFAVSVDTGKSSLLSKDDSVPPSSVIRDRQTGRVVAVEYEPDTPTYDFVAPDHPLCKALRALLAAYPDQHIRLINRTDDDSKAVVEVLSDRNPGEFLLVDVRSMSAEPIISARPWIRPDEMASDASVHFTASDGMKIHGYLTLPKPDPSKRPPPLVVMVHGGPHGIRDHWGFNEEAQLFASQGFAVLRVNYRGSGGYGRRYQESGYLKWGDRIIDDILEATRLVIKKGMVDSSRTCIYGASFGGYAALQSSVRAPELFRCAVGYVGIYDLTLMGNTGDLRLSGLARGYARRVLGENSNALKSASPVYNADKIRARVFLISGKKDERAPIEHSERLRDALIKLGRPPEWLVESTEVHGFWNEGNRERMYTQLMSFIIRGMNLPETLATGAPPKAN